MGEATWVVAAVRPEGRSAWFAGRDWGRVAGLSVHRDGTISGCPDRSSWTGLAGRTIAAASMSA